MSIFILWISFALLIGVIGKGRKIGFGIAFLWAILLSPLIGLVIVLLSDKPKPIVHKFKDHLEAAKKYEFKGDIPAAINSYMDALYHLENDYPNLDKNGEAIRQKHIKQARAKVEELKSK
jgi:hypothetical protein